MKRIATTAAAVIAMATTGLIASGDQRSRKFSESLSGLKEAAAPVSTTGTGTFKATISKDESEINYELTFKDLEGDVRQAHIHIGYPQNSGGIVLWLCQTAANPAPATSPNTPQCTVNDPMNLRAGKVTGTLTQSDVLANLGNGIGGAGTDPEAEWQEVLALVRAGRTYANVHTVKFATGEIRSQIRNEDNDHDDHDEHGGHGGR
jgi:hypothetical protein